MKVIGLIFLSFMFFSQLLCHIDQDEDGLFNKIAKHTQAKPQILFEPKVNQNTDSNVFDIQGMEQFTKLVIKNSHFKPVVLKIYSITKQHDAGKETSVFQAVAQDFKNKVIFAGLNIEKNSDIFMQILMFYNLKKPEFPLFLFYQGGQLKMPFLAGFQPQVSLSGHIRSIFFGEQGQEAEEEGGELWH